MNIIHTICLRTLTKYTVFKITSRIHFSSSSLKLIIISNVYSLDDFLSKYGILWLYYNECFIFKKSRLSSFYSRQELLQILLSILNSCFRSSLRIGSISAVYYNSIYHLFYMILVMRQQWSKSIVIFFIHLTIFTVL